MAEDKIIAPPELSSFCEKLHTTGARIVFTNGVFDLLHPGHVKYLDAARKLGTHLLVALNSDESTRLIKGGKRPLIPLQHRIEVVAALEAVQFVTWFEEETPLAAIHAVRPDVLVKGGDWPLDQIVGREFVKSYGGSVQTVPIVSGYSTTNIVEKILKS